MLDIVRHTPHDASTSVDRWRQTLGVDLEGSTLGVLDLRQFGLGFARFGLALTLRRICPLHVGRSPLSSLGVVMTAYLLFNAPEADVGTS